MKLSYLLRVFCGRTEIQSCPVWMQFLCRERGSASGPLSTPANLFLPHRPTPSVGEDEEHRKQGKLAPRLKRVLQRAGKMWEVKNKLDLNSLQSGPLDLHWPRVSVSIRPFLMLINAEDFFCIMYLGSFHVYYRALCALYSSDYKISASVRFIYN